MRKKATMHLQVFEQKVEATRADLFTALEQYPSSLRKIVVSHVRHRIRKDNSRPVLGEYAPWLIADILNIRDEQSVQRLAVGWLQLYFCMTLTDDLIDNPKQNISPSELMTPLLMLQRSLTAIMRNTGDTEDTLGAMDAAFTNTAFAVESELLSHRKRIKNFCESEIVDIGQKLALLRICGRSIISLCKGPEDSSPWLDIFLSNFALAIQLLDDITDIEEDRESGNFTLPLTIAGKRFPALLQPGALDSTGALNTLIKTKALGKTIHRVHSALQKSTEIMKQKSARTAETALYLDNLLSDVWQLELLIGRLEYRVGNSGRDLTELEISKLRRSLEIVAQSS